ncbi:MAG: double zinc ribbon domain-containing protein, partial [Candidatus Omnitrophica bacterium]|nr:double zinc ribbon domain-containing protein [Candidatus Omnitrophota bacterium]
MKCWLEAGLAFFYPERCQICGAERATPVEGYVGARCWRQLRFIRPPFCARCGLPFEGDITTAFECGNCREIEFSFSSARSAVAAKGVALEVIHRYKYRRALWFEPFLADLLVRQAKPAIEREEWDVIVPVPLYAVKQREREFNQAQRLALRLGVAVSMPVEWRWLARVQPTRTQTL